MIIENVIVSDELQEVFFRCPLHLCHGDCCVEGDAGAPLSEEEIGLIEDLTETILPHMDDEGRRVMNENGSFDYDMSGKMVTPLKPNEECIYLTWENDHTICVFEKLFNEGNISFQKPVSCHLYPIRVVEDGAFDKLLLHRWRICADAYVVGKQEGVRLFEFTKSALIRKYGLGWYNRLMIKCGFDPHRVLPQPSVLASHASTDVKTVEKTAAKSIKKLTTGDTIALAAPSRKVQPQDYEPFQQFLQQLGFRVKLASNLTLTDNQFAGSDEERIDALNELFADPEVKAIIMVRGGYGAARIVDDLNWAALAKHPKWLCGFSDITVFLNHLESACNLPSIHCDMAVHFASAEYRPNFDALLNLLRGDTLEIKLPSHPFNRKGKATGLLVGGNLSVLYSLLGSASFPETSGKILFLEDLDEYLYHIDRMMLGLKRAGVFELVAGVIIGAMSDMRDNEVPFGKTAYEIISEQLDEYNFPLMFGFPAGHTTENQPFFVGMETVMVVGEKDVIFSQQ